MMHIIMVTGGIFPIAITIFTSLQEYSLIQQKSIAQTLLIIIFTHLHTHERTHAIVKGL